MLYRVIVYTGIRVSYFLLPTSKATEVNLSAMLEPHGKNQKGISIPLRSPSLLRQPISLPRHPFTTEGTVDPAQSSDWEHVAYMSQNPKPFKRVVEGITELV